MDVDRLSNEMEVADKMDVHIHHPKRIDIRVDHYTREGGREFATLELKVDDSTVCFYLDNLDQISALGASVELKAEKRLEQVLKGE